MGITADGKLGLVYRPGQIRPTPTCGALVAALTDFKVNSLSMTECPAGTHKPDDPEFSILKQRLAARILHEGADPTKMYLADMTNLAERAITDDLEALIAETVDPDEVDYAVVTGIQVHNTTAVEGEPMLEFVVPRQFYVVNNGEKVIIDVAVRSLCVPDAAWHVTLRGR
jgi:hypothetical protein